MDFQHDGDTVGVALPGDDGVRDETAGVGEIYLGGVAGALEGLFGDSQEVLGGCRCRYPKGRLLDSLALARMTLINNPKTIMCPILLIKTRYYCYSLLNYI